MPPSPYATDRARLRRTATGHRVPFRVRLGSDELDLIDEVAHAHACNRSEALRRLLDIARASRSSRADDAHRDAFADSQSLQRIDDVASMLAALEDRFGKVIVETLMALRVLLHRQDKALLDVTKDMTRRYVERLEQPGSGDP